MKKSLILSLACLMTLSAVAQVQLLEDEVTAVKFVQNETTDWYMLADNPEVTFTDHNPVIKDKTYDLANGDVTTTFGVPVAPIDEWVTLRTGVTANDWNTICMERNITAIDGATFWNVVSETSTEFILEQITEPQAGYGYIIRYTATELKVKYGSEIAPSPVTATAEHPIQGNFAEITCDEHGDNELVGNYVVYQNQLCKVTGWVSMADHRAYVIAGKAPKQAPAPHGAPRMTMPKPNSTPTGLGQSAITNHKSAMKVIENGQFRIVRDNKMYTIMGVEK